MENNQHLISKRGLDIKRIERGAEYWVVHAASRENPICPVCYIRSTSLHSRYQRRLWDMPVQGVPVRLNVLTRRWRCHNPNCVRRIFVERLSEVARPHARWSRAVEQVLVAFGHGAGGRPAERLLGMLGMTASDNTIVRHLRRGVSQRAASSTLRVVGIDDWAWTKGLRYGSITVDLETHTVADVLPDRSAASVAAWLRQHSGVEVVCRDRFGLYAEGARQGAPNARQVADRFHLIDNLRERLEHQMSGHHAPIRSAPVSADIGEMVGHNKNAEPDGRLKILDQFDRVKSLFRLGRTAPSIVRETSLSRKRVDKWIRLDALPERKKMTPTTASPSLYHSHLSSRWAVGVTKIQWLLDEIRRLGYTGCRSRLADYISSWRSGNVVTHSPVSRRFTLPIDPTTNTRISSLVAARLCMKPRPMLSQRQLLILDILKQTVPDFQIMRRLSLRFRGLLLSRAPAGLSRWIADAKQSGIHALQRFAKTLRRDETAVRNAIADPWSSGQVEGQINRLKMLKRGKRSFSYA